MKTTINILCCIFCATLLFSCANNLQNKPTSQKKNILLIVADDMGFADLGSFGSDISTPNIDALATEGIRFSNFHSAPSCAPSRASLLTGTDNHTAGVGSQFHRSKDWGYEGFLSNRVIAIPQLLSENGYNTYMIGKWHLGSKGDYLPHQKGFDRSFILTGGAGNHYNRIGFTRNGSTYRLDGDSIPWPKDAYSTDIYTDSLINFIKNDTRKDAPFFAYAAYTSPHWPLQVHEDYWKKYEAVYADGYEALRIKNLQALKDAGIIAKDHELPPLHPNITPWNELSAEQQKKEVRKMALYAGMLENLDDNIGRIIKHLKETGQYNNTMIIFLSDNGAAYRDPIKSWPFVTESYNNDYENMGDASSFVAYGPAWAEAGSAPFRYYKQYTFEGGIRTPMIIKTGNKSSGSINNSFVTLTDIAPTIYKYAGVDFPTTFKENTISPLSGTSMVPILNGSTQEIHNADEAWMMEHHHHALVRKGIWKLVNPGMDWNEDNFALYNLEQDPTEATNIKEQHPEKFNELMEVWKQYQKDYKLIRYDN